MVVRIRMARMGKAHKPVYNIVVAQQRSGSQKRPMEVLGTYDPMPKVRLPGQGDTTRRYKDVELDTARTKYWLGVGAQPSEPVSRLLSMLGLVEPDWRVEKLRRKAAEADERHRQYWAAKAEASGASEPNSNAENQKDAPVA